MNVLRQEISVSSSGVALVDSPEDLHAILQPECAAALWRRQPLPAFQNWIAGVRPDALPQARVILRPHLVAEAVSAICNGAGLAVQHMVGVLVDDISALAAVFAEITNAPYLRLRLDVVSNNACKKFHIDALTLRLICTYRGTGTQYGISENGAAPDPVFTAPTGAPIVLRGTEFPGDPKSGLLHRSPPIEGTGETRLVLVLDPIYAADDDE